MWTLMRRHRENPYALAPQPRRGYIQAHPYNSLGDLDDGSRSFPCFHGTQLCVPKDPQSEAVPLAPSPQSSSRDYRKDLFKLTTAVHPLLCWTVRGGSPARAAATSHFWITEPPCGSSENPQQTHECRRVSSKGIFLH